MGQTLPKVAKALNASRFEKVKPSFMALLATAQNVKSLSLLLLSRDSSPSLRWLCRNLQRKGKAFDQRDGSSSVPAKLVCNRSLKAKRMEVSGRRLKRTHTYRLLNSAC